MTALKELLQSKYDPSYIKSDSSFCASLKVIFQVLKYYGDLVRYPQVSMNDFRINEPVFRHKAGDEEIKCVGII